MTSSLARLLALLVISPALASSAAAASAAAISSEIAIILAITIAVEVFTIAAIVTPSSSSLDEVGLPIRHG